MRSITKSIRMSDKLGQLTIIGADANPYCHGLYEKGMYDASYTVPKAHNPTIGVPQKILFRS